MNLEHPIITQIRAYGYPKEAVERITMRKASGSPGQEGEHSMETVDISYSNDRFDQWRLGKAGGSISFTKDGLPVFRFENKDQYERYLKLNACRKREEGVE
ncbi:hypothetical protein P4284_16855 [Bacillus swezeyi]|nr:hypothetical protein [Bacillus swezeyi]